MSILSTIISDGLGIKGAAIAVGIAFAAGNISGGVVTSKFFVASEERARIVELNTKLAAKDAAAQANSKALVETRAKLAVLDGVVDGLQKKVSDGDCFVGDDVDAVRDLLGQSKSVANPG